MKAKIGGMTDMLDICGIKLQGHHHSGIDDTKNIASIAIHLMEKGFEFKYHMVLPKGEEQFYLDRETEDDG